MRKISEELYHKIYGYIMEDWDKTQNIMADELLTALENAEEVKE